MSGVPRSRRVLERRSGGKIVRPRRALGSRTPYDRPSLPNQDSDGNPNWLSRLVFSPTRAIATRAGRLLSSVFVSESESDTETESESSGSDSENDMNNDNISYEGTDGLKKKDEISEMVNFMRKEPLPTPMNETKRVIEQLLLQEVFTREECDRFIQVIKSRVVECPTIEDSIDRRLPETPKSTIDTAVLEAKRWLNEKKQGSDSNLESVRGACSLNSAMLSQITNEGGSPVDVAKSYMRARPPWASPSANHFEFRSKSPLGMQLLGDETPYSFGRKSLSSSKVRLSNESPASGSWNIQDEIRRVRSKATEEMLRTLPSAKIDWFSFTSDNKCNPNSLGTEKLDVRMEEKLDCCTKSVNASSNLLTDITSSPDLQVLEPTQDVLQKVSELYPTSTISEQNKELEAITVIEEKGSRNGLGEIISSEHRDQSSEDIRTLLHGETGAGRVNSFKDSNGTNQQLSSTTVGGNITVLNSRLHDGEFSMSNEVVTNNGFPSVLSLSAEVVDTQRNHTSLAEEQNLNCSSQENAALASVPADEKCELLSEACVEVPNDNGNDALSLKENDGAVSSSKNNSNMGYEELSQEVSKPKLRRPGKKGGMVDNKQAKIVRSRYNREGKGRK